MAGPDTRYPGSSHPVVNTAYLAREGGVGIISLVLTIIGMAYIYDSHDADISAIYCVIIVASGSLLGYLVGATFSKSRDDKIKANNRASALAEIDNRHNSIMGTFCNITAILTCFYLIFYFAAMVSMAENLDKGSHFPVDIKVLLLSAVTIGFFGSFSVLYADYVRMTKRLELALKYFAKEGNRDLIQLLRDAVFRGEHLYEPPGNIFVTVGITATFVGLSVGLVILDLPSLLGQADASSAVNPVSGTAQSVGNGLGMAETPQGRGSALASLTAFVGCMGLALGMSMLGVMTAMAAQWLRGLGANSNTEDLLELADNFLARTKVRPAKPRSGKSGSAGPSPPPTDAAEAAVNAADHPAQDSPATWQTSYGQILPDPDG